MTDGTHLPVSALVGADTNYNMSKHSTLENPDVFDGFRFERLRNQENSDSKYQAVSTGNDHLVFGLGTQACPGRLFAIHEAKVVLARFLKYYDFKLSDNPPGHPMRQAAGVLMVIDPTAKIWFKRRSVGLENDIWIFSYGGKKAIELLESTLSICLTGYSTWNSKHVIEI